MTSFELLIYVYIYVFFLFIVCFCNLKLCKHSFQCIYRYSKDILTQLENQPLYQVCWEKSHKLVYYTKIFSIYTCKMNGTTSNQDLKSHQNNKSHTVAISVSEWTAYTTYCKSSVCQISTAMTCIFSRWCSCVCVSSATVAFAGHDNTEHESL